METRKAKVNEEVQFISIPNDVSGNILSKYCF